ncbi:Uncharacterized protein OBRU01_14420 [Operophtera brumata]|uniref:Protein CLP1 homolog n=1 Tax=Operophtera brumata TaxID=104452 RepID=A0A0L7L6K9_OPEBR|nr:Uncharacterized protein OBRU01_14420 [Operophtera brumata]
MTEVQLQEFKLDPDSELRFEVESKNEKVVLEIKSGYAELFGTELVKGKPYEFHTGAKVAVFTWHGCTVELRGRTEVSYVAKETPMVVYLNVHAALEQQRVAAETENTRGPVTMIVGPGDVGKSTLTKLLLNYAVRMGRRPLYVDLDVGQGQISVPGTVGALLIERPASIEEGFSQQAPLVYHFGHKSPSDNLELYNTIVSRLAEVITEKCEGNKKERSTSQRAEVRDSRIREYFYGKRTPYYPHSFDVKFTDLKIYKVVERSTSQRAEVRDSRIREYFYGKRTPYYPHSFDVKFTDLKIYKVVERSTSQRAEVRDSRIREYFYGKRTPYYPHSFDVKFTDLKIYKVGAPSLPDSCMPLGMRREDALTKLVSVWPSPALQHRLLAVSFAAGPDDDVLTSNLAGFVCVTAVDMDTQKLTILSPQPRPLPNTVLLLSELQYMDNQ